MKEWKYSRELSLHCGTVLAVDFFVSDRASRMRLTLSSGNKAELTVPCSCSMEEAQNFLLTSIPWLERMCVKQQKKIADPRRQAVKNSKCSYPAAFTFPAFDLHYDIEYLFRDACWCAVKEVEKGKLLLSGCVTDPELVRDALCSYLARKASVLLDGILQSLASELGFTYQKMTVRIQKGRWGSCSSRGNISLNGRLLFFPEEALRYVLIHELCHLRHMDHSRLFWAEVAKYCPEYQILRDQIRKGFPHMWDL